MFTPDDSMVYFQTYSPYIRLRCVEMSEEFWRIHLINEPGLLFSSPFVGPFSVLLANNHQEMVFTKDKWKVSLNYYTRLLVCCSRPMQTHFSHKS